MARLLLLNGPNINLLGRREPGIYGKDTLEQITSRLEEKSKALGHELLAFQSNAEHELVDRVQKSMDESVDFIMINPAAYTHTSVALRDALSAVNIPFVEIHLSNIYGRESFRRKSYFSDLAVGVISGCGALGYELALQFAHETLSRVVKKNNS
ncbi:MAG: type II 3-dehydroquinate dehydratase [Gammaproteobacteria bacterium]|nr:type II 3-dehydroquinate dehydratase [Gammaproteobacteria bacterium]